MRKIATVLLASVILSASCLLCFMPVTSVSAASPSSLEIQTEQHQNCEKHKTISFTQEQGPRSTQDPVCGHAHDQANINNAPSPWTDRHPIAHGAFVIHQIRGLDHHRSFDPSYAFPNIHHFLVGTTIKRE